VGRQSRRRGCLFAGGFHFAFEGFERGHDPKKARPGPDAENRFSEKMTLARQNK